MPSIGVGRIPSRAPYAAPTSEPLSDWLYFAAPPSTEMLNSLSAIATAGTSSAAAARATRSFLMCTYLLTGIAREIERALRERGDRDGKDAEERRPAWPAAPGAAVGPVKLELQKDLARHLRGGHPWVYKRALERAPQGLAAGAIVDVTAGGKFVAR